MIIRSKNSVDYVNAVDERLESLLCLETLYVWMKV